jgi:uncharacterized protein (TIGR03066 family)
MVAIKFFLMKKVKLFTTLLMVVLCVGFTSCSNDDDKSEPSITGTWVLTKSISGLANSTERSTSYPGEKDENTMTFNSDGSFSYTNTEDGRTESGSGKYTYDPAKKLLTTTDTKDGKTETVTVMELTEKSLVISSTLEKENEYYEAYFERK